MKFSLKYVLMTPLFLLLLLLFFPGSSLVSADPLETSNAAFDINKMADMSDYDPSNPVVPTGETIKIAVVASFSGPGAINGQLYWIMVQWAAHDINKRGGIFVDGKKKLVQVLKADHMGKPDQCKKICERMILQEKVHALWGTDGSHLMKIINEVANKYKVISLNASSGADDIQDATNFGRYSFMTAFSTIQQGRGMAYFYGQIRKKEKKFYILNQDYGMGHILGQAFRDGLKEYYPEAQVVGEDYHKLFLTDFAPYLTKIKASGAEVIFTGDWSPDCKNLLKQARQLGIDLPFANVWMSEVGMLKEIGIDGTKGLINISPFDVPTPFKAAPGYARFFHTWNSLWKNKWKEAPYNSPGFEHLVGAGGTWLMNTYWLLSVMERAGSTDPEKIIRVWEGDTYRYVNGKVVKMRPCDHKIIQDLGIAEYVPPEQQKVSMTIPPYYWFNNTSFTGPVYKIPAAKVMPWMDQKLDRCKGKSGWGE
jgi:branched-chain amino acid transport system substrate-binding protein